MAGFYSTPRDGGALYNYDLTAYAVWLSLGNTGTRADYLATLVGPQGAQGVSGATGPAGPGVPTGGTVGQRLVKTSATDYATAWTGYRGARARRAAAQSIPHNAETILSFDTEDRDTSGFFDLTAPTRLTIPAGVSLVRLTSQVFWSGAAPKSHLLVFKNGVVFAGRPALEATGAAIQVVSDVIDVVPGDYFDNRVYQYSGAALNTGADIWFALEVLQ